MTTEVTPDNAVAFYRAALAAGIFLDQGSSDRAFDADADVAWRTYGADLPLVIRIDMALRNLAMLYPAAFAPGPLFQLPGWYEDDPWGVGFERPPRDELEALFRSRSPQNSPGDVLAHAAAIWGAESAGTLSVRWTPTTQVLVAGPTAMVSVVSALAADAACDVRSQVVLVSDGACARHLLGIASALRRSSGMPRFLASSLSGSEGVLPATVMVTSKDATVAERAATTRLADQWNILASERYEA
jgi:hypothetical protein